MFRKSLIAAALCVAGAAQAATIDSRATGIANPSGAVNFDEVSLVNGTLVTNQYAAFGVTFMPGVTYLDRVSPRPNFENPAAVTFQIADGQVQAIDPVSLRFGETVEAASFAMTLSANTTRFTALLGGIAQRSFETSVVDAGSANNFYGFENIRFDEILIDVQSGDRTGALDTISFRLAEVPLPAGLPLLIGALSVFAVLRRRF
jgi:hypothetical protein